MIARRGPAVRRRRGREWVRVFVRRCACAKGSIAQHVVARSVASGRCSQALRITAFRAIDCRKYHDTWRLGDAERQNVADDSISCKRFHEALLSRAFGRRQAQHSSTTEQPCVAHAGISSNQLHEMLPCATFRRRRGNGACASVQV